MVVVVMVGQRLPLSGPQFLDPISGSNMGSPEGQRGDQISTEKESRDPPRPMVRNRKPHGACGLGATVRPQALNLVHIPAL